MSEFVDSPLRPVIRLTLIAAGLAAVSAAAFIWWFPTELVGTGLYLLATMASVLAVPLIYRFSGSADAELSRWLERREAAESARMLERAAELGRELDEVDQREAAAQAGHIGRLIDDFHKTIESRFRHERHRPAQYLSVARRAQNVGLENLDHVLTLAHSVRTLRASPDEAQGEPDTARSDRLTARADEQRSLIEQRLEENRALFEALGTTAAEVAAIDPTGRYERLETLAHLEDLARIAEHSIR